MNKLKLSLYFLTFVLITSPLSAAMITNGDFANSCNTDSWDTYGDVTVSGTPGYCAVDLAVNDDDFEAELSQSLTLVAGFDYLLSLDFKFTTSLPSIEDSFFVSLLNEDSEIYDLLLPADFGIGSNSNSFLISSDDLLNNYVNQNWSLSFYLYDEIYDDASSANVSISKVTLSQVVSEVPAPGSLALFALGFAGLMGRRKLSRSIVCHSQVKE